MQHTNTELVLEVQVWIFFFFVRQIFSEDISLKHSLERQMIKAGSALALRVYFLSVPRQFRKYSATLLSWTSEASEVSES